MEFHIEGRNVSLPETLRADIEDKLIKLSKGQDDIIHARVTVQKDTKHQNGFEAIAIVLQVRGDTLTVHKSAATLVDVVQAGFSALQRELKRYREKWRQRSWTVHGESTAMTGQVARVFHDRDYGFIEAGNGDEIFFHRTSVVDVPFESLEAGASVEFTVEQGDQGPKASRLWLAGAQG